MNGHHVHHPCRSFKCLCDLALSSSLNFSDLCHMREQHATDRSYSLQILEREDLWAKRSSAKLAIWLQRITSPHRATYNQKVFVVSHWDLWPHFWVNMCVCVYIYIIFLKGFTRQWKWRVRERESQFLFYFWLLTHVHGKTFVFIIMSYKKNPT